MEKSLHTQQQKILQQLLKDARIKAGLKQIDLSGRVGKPQSFVSKYEKGERLLDIIELRQVCLAIGIPLKVFIQRLEGAINET